MFPYPYTMDKPSKDYQELQGYAKNYADDITTVQFNPFTLREEKVEHLPPLKAVIEEYGAQSMLHYGCADGDLYKSNQVNIPDIGNVGSVQDYLNIQDITVHDAYSNAFGDFPTQKADIVFCSHTLEHFPEEDLYWIVDTLFSLANKVVYFNLEALPSDVAFPNGRNAHYTIMPAHWWHGFLNYMGKRHPDVHWELRLEAFNIKTHEKEFQLVKG